MNRYDLFNGLAFIFALAIASAGVISWSQVKPTVTTLPALEPDAIERLSLPDGTLAIKDAQGALIPLRPYQRIVSLGIASDALLAELCEPNRIVAVSTYLRGPLTVRFGGIPRLAGLENIEAIIAHKPDLVLVSAAADEADRVTRLREAGLTVCDLGMQGGVSTLIPNLRRIGALINADDRAQKYINLFNRRLANVAASLPTDQPKRRALYLAVFGREIYGGTVGSSFHDILHAAGLIDVAAETLSGWPALSLEQIVAFNPEIIVCSPTSASALRALPGVNLIHALEQPTSLITVDGELLEDPGPRLLEAAEVVFELAYPKRASQ
jgi:iron complex transport system substrate-binding protein